MNLPLTPGVWGGGGFPGKAGSKITRSRISWKYIKLITPTWLRALSICANFCLLTSYRTAIEYMWWFQWLRLHSLCILQGGGGGGAEDFRGVLKFLEQEKGGYENCLNISRGMLIFCKILSSFCNSFKKWKKKMISKDCKRQGYLYYSET